MKIDSDQILALAEAVAYVGHWSWNFDTQEVFWSPECYNIFGRDPATWIPTGENFRDDMPDEDREKLEEANLRGFESGDPFQLEYRYFRGGSRDDVRWIGVFCDFLVDASGTNHMVGIAQDITESKRVEVALRESEERFRLLTDALPALISYVDSQEYYRLNNTAYERWFEHPREEICGRHVKDVLGEATYDTIKVHIDTALSGEAVTYEALLPYKDGGQRFVRANYVPHVAESGHVYGFFVLVEDLTDIRRAEESIRTLNEELERRVEERTGALRRLSGRLISVQEDERSRIARDLHDDFSQRLAILAVGLERLKHGRPDAQDNFANDVASLLQLTKELASGFHQMSHQLHPSILEHLGLLAALKSFCKEISGQHDIRIDIVHNRVPRSLSSEVNLCLYRIIQEAFRNVIKHSGAQNARIEFEESVHELTMRISDDGVGFDLESARTSGGLGLLSMRERLRLVNGTISFNRIEPTGTRVEVRIQIPESNQL